MNGAKMASKAFKMCHIGILSYSLTVKMTHALCCCRWVLLPLFGFLVQTGVIAADTLRWYRSLPVRALYATADQLGQAYVLTPERAVLKFDSTGRQTAFYTNRRLGDPARIDAANPLKLLVWYPDFQTVVFLDRTLTEMGRLSLLELGFNSVQSVALAADGNLWVFDAALAKAVKLTPEGQRLFESQPLNLLFPGGFSAYEIHDNGVAVFLSDPQQGFCILDPYANVLRADPFLKIGDFDLAGEWLLYIDGQWLYRQHPVLHQTERLGLPPGANSWIVGASGLFHCGAAQVDWYRWD